MAARGRADQLSSASLADAAPRRRRGFTLVEMLVVIGIIAVLMGLLLVGLQAAQKASRRTKQLSDLRQVYQGWTQYANTYNDAAMPGFMDDGVQSAWKVSYKAKDGTKIPAQYARTYPWRLLPYLDHSITTLYGYLDAEDESIFAAKNPDGTLNDAGLQIVADQPAFGYNGYYLGGWWTSNPGPTLTFGNGTWQDSEGTTSQGRIVATTVSGVSAPDRMVSFASSTFREPGFYKEDGAFTPGAAWIVPHVLADTPIWAPSDGASFGDMQARRPTVAWPMASLFLADIVTVQSAGAGLQVDVAQAVPLRRFGTVAVVHVDGNTTNAGIGELLDQRRWMNPASSAANPNTFTHTPN
jgi:prepilin-type N-terminal cleavage/methylation domain-containing protein